MLVHIRAFVSGPNDLLFWLRQRPSAYLEKQRSHMQRHFRLATVIHRCFLELRCCRSDLRTRPNSRGGIHSQSFEAIIPRDPVGRLTAALSSH